MNRIVIHERKFWEQLPGGIWRQVTMPMSRGLASPTFNATVNKRDRRRSEA